MLQYAPLRPGLGFDPLRAALYYAQRLVPAPLLRRAVAGSVAAAINLRHKRPPSGPLANDIVGTLNSKGYAIIPDRLTDREIEEMLAYLARQPVILRDGRTVALEDVPAATTIADYALDTVLACPHMLELANAPDMIALATRFLGCMPTISTIGIRWSYPGSRDEATTQGFHRDPDDWRFFKFFIYLTDVDEECGPHLYVRGSNRTTGTFRAARFADAAVERDYGREAIVAITGPRGTSFVADTYGIHAGPIPTAKPRLMLEVGYSVLPVFAIRYQPVALRPRPPVDAYVNRLLLAAE
jgi:hypothetical protein